MTASRFAQKHGFTGPLDTCFHHPDSTVEKNGGQLSTGLDLRCLCCMTSAPRSLDVEAVNMRIQIFMSDKLTPN
jgi:hypothetical protein